MIVKISFIQGSKKGEIKIELLLDLLRANVGTENPKYDSETVNIEISQRSKT